MWIFGVSEDVEWWTLFNFAIEGTYYSLEGQL